MLKVGLVGLGFMGASHLGIYKQMEANNLPVKLVAICDVDEKKFGGQLTQGNLDTTDKGADLSAYKLYSDMEEMIEKEDLDYVDLCLPTYLHAPMAITAMNKGVHVFCEKPMAINSHMCEQMIQASKNTGKSLMIGQTLRYWNVYEYVKECIDDGRYGNVVCAYLYRGGSTPIWSWENWLLRKDCSGGCLLDQHIHDVDAINWLFGMPKSVSSAGVVVNKGNGFDVVSTNYLYGDKVVNAQDDWTINGNGYGFEMLYRINFEKGALIYNKGKLKVHPVDAPAFEPELSDESAYYKEIRLFAENLLAQTEGYTGAAPSQKLDFFALLESHKDTIVLAEAENKSAEQNGVVVNV